MSTETTKEIVTSVSANKVVIRTSISYGDNQDILDVYREEGVNRKDTLRKADKMGIEKIVVSIDGKTADIYEEFKKLNNIDAMEVAVFIKEILEPSKKAMGSSSQTTPAQDSSKEI